MAYRVKQNAKARAYNYRNKGIVSARLFYLFKYLAPVEVSKACIWQSDTFGKIKTNILSLFIVMGKLRNIKINLNFL